MIKISNNVFMQLNDNVALLLRLYDDTKMNLYMYSFIIRIIYCVIRCLNFDILMSCSNLIRNISLYKRFFFCDKLSI